MRIMSTFILVMAFCHDVYGWGQKGHDVTAAVATLHLTRESREMVRNLFEGKSLMYWANWMDNASHSSHYANTLTWHYVNVDDGENADSVITSARTDSTHIVWAIGHQVEVLKSELSTRTERQVALRMLVHLVGDIHQPMHVGHRSDRGGNEYPVVYFGATTDLHTVWDTRLVESAHAWSYTEWAKEIDSPVIEENGNRFDLYRIYAQGSPADWALETHRVARDIYTTTPQGSSLSYDWVAQWTPVLEQQLHKAGCRLAMLINEITAQNETEE